MNAKSSQVYEHGCYNTLKTYLLATAINQHSNSIFYVLNFIMHIKNRQAILKGFFNLNTEQSCPF